MQLFLSDPLLDGLNSEQERAVVEIDGPVQVVASAGSGKTTVLTRRIAYMLNQGINPSSILAVTFTKKAATEMISRLKKLVTSKKLVENILIGTYHSVFLDILDGNYGALGFTSDSKPNICMDSRQKTIIKTILSELNASFTSDETLTLLGQIKNMGIYPEELQSYISRGLNPVVGVNTEDLPEILNIYNYYQNYLRDSNLIDFDDILMLTRKLLQTNEKVRTELQQKYKYVLVDEFQDVNQVQYDITKILAAPQNNLFVVGDDAQSIYQFRGSDVGIILNFSKEYPNTNMIKLESNYRCTPEIIELSNKLIKFNTDQIPKIVKASKPSIRDSVNFYIAPDVTEESFFVAKQIKGLLYKGIKPEEIAILYRSHAQATYLEDDLTGWGIPYVIHKNGSFYDLPEIQDLFAFLYIARGKKEDLEEGIERVFRASNVVPKTLEFIRAYAKNNEVDLMNATLAATSLNIHPGQRVLLERTIIPTLFGIRRAGEQMEVPELIKHILEVSGYVKKLEHKGTESAYNAINNLSYMYDRAVKWECKTIDDFFNAVKQQEMKKKDSKGKKQAVQLMTIHTSKGMEFDAVFLIGMEEEILPHKKSMTIKGGVKEERRLGYVAMTRARKYLNLSYVENRRRFDKMYKTNVSRFWQEVNDQVIMEFAKEEF